MPTLRKIGFQANRRVLQVQSLSQDVIVAQETLQQLQRPRQAQGQKVSALHLADPTLQGLWNAVLLFERLPAGFSNRQLRAVLAQLLGQPEESFTQGRMSYHLRRLRLHGWIQRIPKTHPYRLTSFGLRTTLFCTRAYTRVFRRGMILPAATSVTSSLRRSFDRVEQQINLWVQHARMAA